MTTETKAASAIGADLTTVLLQELRTLPMAFAQLDQDEQQAIIDRIKANVKEATVKAAAIIAAEGRVAAVGTLEAMSFKKKVGANITLLASNRHLPELSLAHGKQVLVVLLPTDYMAGADIIQADPQQRPLPGTAPGTDDELYDEAVSFARERDSISVGDLQAFFKIGAARAGKLFQALVANKVVDAAEDDDGGHEVF